MKNNKFSNIPPLIENTEMIHDPHEKSNIFNDFFSAKSSVPNSSKEDICNIDRSNLSRFNRSYQVFKNMRGTSMYYEESKKNLMALLRQNGCPSVFLTISCAEFDWPELLKEI